MPTKTQPVEPGSKKTHAQRRRDEARTAVRERLDAQRYVKRLEAIATRAPRTAPDKIPALALQANIYLRLLGKVLPDLKAVEMTGELEHRAYVISGEPLTESAWQAKYGPGAAGTPTS